MHYYSSIVIAPKINLIIRYSYTPKGSQKLQLDTILLYYTSQFNTLRRGMGNIEILFGDALSLLRTANNISEVYVTIKILLIACSFIACYNIYNKLTNWFKLYYDNDNRYYLYFVTFYCTLIV